MIEASTKSTDDAASRNLVKREGKFICRINVYPIRENHCPLYDGGGPMQSISPGGRLVPDGMVPY